MQKPKFSSLLARLENEINARPDCSATKIGLTTLLVIQRREVDSITTVNAAGFNPYDKRETLILSKVFWADVRSKKDEPTEIGAVYPDGSQAIAIHAFDLSWLDPEA